ncbi:SWIM zinc finger family protein [Streptomyces sp. NPDC088801]|uniref:SWIM zinc finger family protein n=1 Tax=Streptomyces sp. NPDC088801 TaxID=3365903 RepID=UPI0037F14529
MPDLADTDTDTDTDDDEPATGPRGRFSRMVDLLYGPDDGGPERPGTADSPEPRPQPSAAPTGTSDSVPGDSHPALRTDDPARREGDLAPQLDGRAGRDVDPVPRTDGPARRDGGSVLDGPARREGDLAPQLDGQAGRDSHPALRTDGPARPDGDLAPQLDGQAGRDVDPVPHTDGPARRDGGSVLDGPARRDGAFAPHLDAPARPHPDAPVPRDPDPAPHTPAPMAPPPAPDPAPAPPGARFHHPVPSGSGPVGPTPPSTPPTRSVSHTPRSARSTPSMAAPTRDHELRRTFPPFPPRDGDRFAESWWGNAWVGALEQGALDVKRLERGRAYAGQGHVDAITVTPGLVLAYVQGSRPRPYRVQVHLRTLDDTDWDRFLDVAADRPGHIAALLDREMPQSLAECGVPLLPGPGDLEPRCSCPDRGHPCKHAAALCYQTARLLDADPFVLLLLRGRGERELLDALSRLSATRAARAARDKGPAPLPGVRAAEVLASRALPPLPAPLPPPAHPEQPPAYPAAPGGPDPFALDQLATDAAARAHALLCTGRDPVGRLTFWQDAVRLAAARPGVGLTAGTRSLYSSLASAAGRTPSELARAVAAWRQGGLEGLAVLEEPWDPPAGRFDRARPLLLAADLPAFRPWRNHLTHPRGHLQLRLGRDGLWYAYESEPGHDDWWPRGTPDLDPVGALTGLGLPSDT